MPLDFDALLGADVVDGLLACDAFLALALARASANLLFAASLLVGLLAVAVVVVLLAVVVVVGVTVVSFFDDVLLVESRCARFLAAKRARISASLRCLASFTSSLASLFLSLSVLSSLVALLVGLELVDVFTALFDADDAVALDVELARFFAIARCRAASSLLIGRSSALFVGAVVVVDDFSFVAVVDAGSAVVGLEFFDFFTFLRFFDGLKIYNKKRL